MFLVLLIWSIIYSRSRLFNVIFIFLKTGMVGPLIMFFSAELILLFKIHVV